MSAQLMNQHLEQLLSANNLRTGSSFENRVTWQLYRMGAIDQIEYQYPIGRYRLDYAWPKKWIALEADGFYHSRPEVAVKDVARDTFLRSRGWLVFRIHDDETMVRQVARVAVIVKDTPDGIWDEAARGWQIIS
jgi:very-short-patch-repair endonuclease